MLAVRVAWLLSKMKDPGVGGVGSAGSPQTAATSRNKTAAVELFAGAHERLQLLLGPMNVASFLAAPGLIRTLRELDRSTEALKVEEDVTRAVNRALRCHQRCCLNLCHEDGRANWLWRAATVYMDVLMPPIRIESVLADSGRSPPTSRWLWLRAEVTAASTCQLGAARGSIERGEEQTLACLRAAVSAGCCFSPLSDPVFDYLHEQVMRASVDPTYQSPDKNLPAAAMHVGTRDWDEEDGGGSNPTSVSTVADELHAIDTIAVGNLWRASVWRALWAVFGFVLVTGMLGLQVLLMEGLVAWPDLGRW